MLQKHSTACWCLTALEGQFELLAHLCLGAGDGRFGGKQWHVGWGGEASRDRSAIEIPSKLAQLLDIPHGTGLTALWVIMVHRV